jgi:4-diphosphocytidyl-2-C-methyl-D-erythritol kinase
MSGRKPVFEEFAPAKINLYLKVGAARADGYHPLDSLAAFASVGDRVRVTPGSGISLSVTGPFANSLAVETNNIVLKAAHELVRASRRA